MSSRKPLIAGNWKLYKTVDESVAFVRLLAQEIASLDQAEVVVAPTFLAIHPVASALQGSVIRIAAQNVYPKSSGAFTGEISAPLLKAAGCTFCIVGHSERRTIQKEDDSLIREKTLALLHEGLTPIVCIGEHLHEREAGQTFERVKTQMQAILASVEAAAASRLVFAYEPVWAIGTGKTASPSQAQEVHAYLRQLLHDHYPSSIAEGIRLLYGGSVKADNIDALMKEPDIDGALVGGASLDLASFVRIARFVL